VRQATPMSTPHGHAAKANVMPWFRVNPAAGFEMVAESCGGHGVEGRESGGDQVQCRPLRAASIAIRIGHAGELNVTTQKRVL